MGIDIKDGLDFGFCLLKDSCVVVSLLHYILDYIQYSIFSFPKAMTAVNEFDQRVSCNIDTLCNLSVIMLP